MKLTIDNEEYLDIKEVMEVTGIKQANLYIKMRCNEFPKPEKKSIPTTVTFTKKTCPLEEIRN